MNARRRTIDTLDMMSGIIKQMRRVMISEGPEGFDAMNEDVLRTVSMILFACGKIYLELNGGDMEGASRKWEEAPWAQNAKRKMGY